MKIEVNATRMELLRLKRRLAVAGRGHKLLRDKLDELMRRFMELVSGFKSFHHEVEEELIKAYRNFICYQQYAVAIRNLPYCSQISLGGHDHPARALHNWFDSHSRNLISSFGQNLLHFSSAGQAAVGPFQT